MAQDPPRLTNLFQNNTISPTISNTVTNIAPRVNQTKKILLKKNCVSTNLKATILLQAKFLNSLNLFIFQKQTLKVPHLICSHDSQNTNHCLAEFKQGSNNNSWSNVKLRSSKNPTQHLEQPCIKVKAITKIS